MTFELNSPREEKGMRKASQIKERGGQGPLERETTNPQNHRAVVCMAGVNSKVVESRTRKADRGQSLLSQHLCGQPCAQLRMGYNDKRGAGNTRMFGHTICLIHP